MIDLIKESGYVEAKWANDSSANTENGADDVEIESAEEEEELIEEVANKLKVEEEMTKDDDETNGHDLIVDENEEAKAKMLGQSIAPVQEPIEEPLPVFPNPPQVSENLKTASASVSAPEPSFNFLQESQIDLESPHMDPAVVMVHPPKRPAVPVHQVKASQTVIQIILFLLHRVSHLEFQAKHLPTSCSNSSPQPSSKLFWLNSKLLCNSKQ